MNDFENLFDRKITADDVLNSIESSDSKDKALTAAVISTFFKKKDSLEHLISAVRCMDMFAELMSSVSKNKKIGDVPNNTEMIEQGDKLVSAINGIIEAFQRYGIESAKFNEVSKQEIINRENFVSTIDDSAEE